MSDLVAVSILGGCFSLANTIVTVINGQAQARHAAEADRKRQALSKQIEVVRQDVNGKMAELLRVNGEAEKAKGRLEGKLEQTTEGNH